MIIRTDPINKILFIDGPIMFSEFLDVMWELVFEGEEEEWTIVPAMEFHFSAS